MRTLRALTLLALLALLTQSARAGPLGLPTAVENRYLYITQSNGQFPYDQTLNPANPLAPVTLNGFIEGRYGGFGYLNDTIAEFNIAGVSTATPVNLTLDIHQALQNNLTWLPIPSDIGIGIKGTNGPIQPDDFPTLSQYSTPLPGWSYTYMEFPLGNYAPPLAESVDITSEIGLLKAEGFGSAEIFFDVGWSSDIYGPPSTTFSFDSSAVPEPPGLTLAFIGAILPLSVIVRKRFIKRANTRAGGHSVSEGGIRCQFTFLQKVN